MVEITEDEARGIVWRLKEFASKLRSDADYYDKQAEILKKKYRVKE